MQVTPPPLDVIEMRALLFLFSSLTAQAARNQRGKRR
jgi:hypothetical protein